MIDIKMWQTSYCSTDVHWQHYLVQRVISTSIVISIQNSFLYLRQTTDYALHIQPPMQLAFLEDCTLNYRVDSQMRGLQPCILIIAVDRLRHGQQTSTTNFASMVDVKLELADFIKTQDT